MSVVPWQRAVLLLATLLLTACGDAPTPEMEVPSWAKVAPEQLAEAKKHGVPVAFENDLGMRFVLIPAGTFLMGSPEGIGAPQEWPQHEVTLTRPYYVQITEVTNAQYRRFRPEHDSGRSEAGSLDMESQPVVMVSSDAAMAFAAFVSDQDPAHAYRLPTEAEWERACRAGTDSRYWSGDAEADLARVAWCMGNAGGLAQDGWGKPPSPFGLFDMHGNAAEWTSESPEAYPQADVADPVWAKSWETYRVLRGGSWKLGATNARSATRIWTYSSERLQDLGFRLVSPLPARGER